MVTRCGAPYHRAWVLLSFEEGYANGVECKCFRHKTLPPGMEGGIYFLGTPGDSHWVTPLGATHYGPSRTNRVRRGRSPLGSLPLLATRRPLSRRGPSHRKLPTAAPRGGPGRCKLP